MAEPKENPLMEKIVSLCKRRGFIFQSSEIYGGINGFWDYGPLGAELKRNVKELWWTTMTRRRDDVVGLEATIIMSPEIWRASGHVDTFVDMMRECPMTKKRARVDQVDPKSGIVVSYLGCLPKTGPLSLNVDGKQVIVDSPEGEVLERFISAENPKTLKNISLLKLAALAEDFLRNSYPKTPAKDLEESAKGLASRIQSFLNAEGFAFLLPPGKPNESARKLASQFYQSKGVSEPVLVGESTYKVENSVDFHPESGVMMNESRPFNLMFRTSVGPLDVPQLSLFYTNEHVDIEAFKEWKKAFDAWHSNIAYLRPETAQAIFAQFKNVLETSRQKVPFGIAQVGKAFRNEVTPRNFTFRSREFEQMELEFFIKPDEVVEAIQFSVSSVQPAPSELKTENLKLETSPAWGWKEWHKYWVEERVRFYESIGLSRDTLGFHVQTPEELAHYARATTDILFKFPFSKKDGHGNVTGDELEGIAARSDFDLSQHERFSGKPMGVFDDELRVAWAKLDEAKKKEFSDRYYESRKKYLTKTAKPDDTPEKIEKEAREDAEGLAKGQYIPHVIEPSAGVDRLILALICNAYQEDQMPDEKGKLETRVVMKFHPRVAPIKAGVMPLLKNKPELVKKALEIRDVLRPHMNVFYDDAGAIGRRYRRQDEAGTPFCVTVDFETLEGVKEGALAGQKETVTLRYRDDGRQDRVKISDLLPMLLEKIR